VIYRHTQIGYGMFFVGVSLAALVAARVRSWALFGVMCLVTAVASALFGTLTIEVGGAAVVVRFGPVGLVRERIATTDIVSARAVRNSPLYGWGMRYIRNGRLWSIWGLDAVELQLTNGSRFRIGTSQPAALLAALKASGVAA